MKITTLVKFAITCVAVAWNCLLVTGAVMVWKHLASERVTVEEARLLVGLSVILLFSAILPLLGAYASHAKGRGAAEGYNLATYFNLIGLIVVLCLPTNRDGG